jgi:hypothetical protein
VKQWEELDAPSGLHRQILASIDGDTKPPTTITWPKTCPVVVGDEISLRRSKAFDPETLWSEAVPSLWIKITELIRGKKGEHVATFQIVDHRPRYLKHGGGVTTSRSESVDREADYDQAYAEARAVEARKNASQSLTERDSAYRSFREELKEIRRELGPYADAVLLAELKRVLATVKAGDLGG